MRILLPLLALILATSCAQTGRVAPVVALGKLSAVTTAVEFSGLHGKDKVTMVGQIILVVQAPSELAGTKLRIWINEETPIRVGDVVDLDLTNIKMMNEDGILSTSILVGFPYQVRPGLKPEPAPEKIRR